MIARVKHPLGTMYMPLWRLDSGQWIPIGPLAATMPDAQRICNRRMRVATVHFEGRSELVKVNLERLHAEPDSEDRIFILGMARSLDEDGALVLPDLPLALDEACIQILSAALDIDPAAERPEALIADYLDNEPLMALSAVANVRPDLLVHLVAYMTCVDALDSLQRDDTEEHPEVNIERLEMIDGELIEKPGASFAHGVAHMRIGAALAEIEGLPGGWSFGASVELELEPNERYLPDVAGWRWPSDPVRMRPDWVCEILSPETAIRDLGHKRAVYHRAGIAHYWVFDLEHGIIMALRWHERGYVVAQVAGFEECLRLEPFDEHEIDLSGLAVLVNAGQRSNTQPADDASSTASEPAKGSDGAES